MFNYFIQKKVQENQLQKEEGERKKLILQNKREKFNQKCIKKYQEKMLRVVPNSQNKQTQVLCGKPKEIQRMSSSLHTIGPKGFYYHPRCTKDRVDEELKKNSDMDPVPFSMNQSYNFREQKNTKPIKYTPLNSYTRLKETMMKIRTNQIPSCWDLNKKMKNLEIKKQNRTSIRKKNILPELNKKRFPNSYIAMSNETVFGCLKNVDATKSCHINNHRLALQRQKMKKQKNSQDRKIKFNTIHHDT